MKKKLLFIIVSVVLLFSLFSIGAFAEELYSVTQNVGGSYAEFTKNYYFDNQKGIISASYNCSGLDEAAIKVMHTTKSHYGTVSYSSRNEATNTATAGNWTSKADVWVTGSGQATYKACN